jgi:hypothetical protein
MKIYDVGQILQLVARHHQKPLLLLTVDTSEAAPLMSQLTEAVPYLSQMQANTLYGESLLVVVCDSSEEQDRLFSQTDADHVSAVRLTREGLFDEAKEGPANT